MTTEPSPDPRDVIAGYDGFGAPLYPHSGHRDRHRDVIARVIWQDGRYGWHEAQEATHALLAAIDTDPAVADALITGHTDAILAALTRAGVLKEEGIEADRDGAVTQHRLVTPWRAAP